MTTTGVLLAAGGGSRFAGPTHKLLATVDGIAIVRRSLDNVLAAGLDHVVVVTGAVDLAVGVDLTAVEVVHNPKWEQGQATSLHAGLAAAAVNGSEFAVVGLADQPFVPSSAWRAVATARSPAPIVVATYGGVRGPNPVRLHAAVWSQMPTDGDEGARSLMRLHPDWVNEVACDGSAADIDTLEDLTQWTSS
ncbi:MAG TPA: nucleotidyltransferase family protein [Ilumatobacteraceae bacterium]